MTEKLALTCTLYILRDELDRIKKDDIDYDEEYYLEIKEAMEKIKEMVSQR